MQRSKPFYSEFLSELKALDDFLLRGQRRIPYVERTDPDVRRLMESMAFFAARSRKMAVDGFGAAVTRLAAGHLDELLRAQPSRALVQAHPDPRMVEPVRLPKDTTVRILVENQAFGGGGPANRPTIGLFNTTCSTTLLPLAVQSAKLGLRAGSGFRIVIGLRAYQPIYWRPEPLSFHISLLDDYHSSRQFLYAIENHLQAASVGYGEVAPEPDTSGQRCEVTYGPHPAYEQDDHPDPLTTVRQFFHFPEEELFLHVHLPERERPWRRAWLCLDMDEDWPASMVVNKDAFQLFVIPLTNARREPAEPILCDGTQDSYPIRPVGFASDDSLHRVAGVYREVESGWQPLLPEHLSPIADDNIATFEVHRERTEDDELGEPRLLLNIPDAFDDPCKIAVDSYFYQPWFDAYVDARMKVALQTRKIDGVGWQLRGQLRKHRPSQIHEKPFEMLHLLALMGQTMLSLHDIQYILQFVGADEKSTFGEVVDLMTGLRLTEERTLEGDGTEYVYHITWQETQEDVAALMSDLSKHLHLLLDAWSQRPVRVATESPDRPGKRLAR